MQATRSAGYFQGAELRQQTLRRLSRRPGRPSFTMDTVGASSRRQSGNRHQLSFLFLSLVSFSFLFSCFFFLVPCFLFLVSFSCSFSFLFFFCFLFLFPFFLFLLFFFFSLFSFLLFFFSFFFSSFFFFLFSFFFHPFTLSPFPSFPSFHPLLSPPLSPPPFPPLSSLSPFSPFPSFSLLTFEALSVKQRILVETDHGRKSVTARMDDSDASPISESEVLEGSVASAAAGGSGTSTDPRLRSKGSRWKARLLAVPGKSRRATSAGLRSQRPRISPTH